MFINLIKNTDFLQQIKKRAKDRIKNKRQFKENIFKIIKNYCKTNNFIINDIYKLIGEKKSLDEPINILCNYSYSNSVKMTDYLFNNNFKEIQLSTEIYNKKFNLYWKGHKIAIIYETKIDKINSIFNIFFKEEIDGQFYIGKINQLIELYYNNFNLSQENNKKENERLISLIKNKINWTFYIIKGGKNNNKNNNKNGLELIKTHFFNDFLAIENKKIILLDEYAINLFINKKYNYKNPITFISTVKFNIIYNLLINFIKGITNFKLSYKIEESNLIHNPRLKKYIIYICVPDNKNITCKRTILFNIYNLCEYQIVSYNIIKGINIGTKNVLSYFILLNTWYLKKLFINNKIKKETFNFLSSKYISNFKKLNNFQIKKIHKHQKIYYIGTNYDNYIYYKYKFLDKPCSSYLPILKKNNTK